MTWILLIRTFSLNFVWLAICSGLVVEISGKPDFRYQVMSQPTFLLLFSHQNKTVFRQHLTKEALSFHIYAVITRDCLQIPVSNFYHIGAFDFFCAINNHISTLIIARVFWFKEAISGFRCHFSKTSLHAWFNWSTIYQTVSSPCKAVQNDILLCIQWMAFRLNFMDVHITGHCRFLV